MKPIWDAYADADMTSQCLHCQAAPNVFCTNTITGRVRRTPCLARTTSDVAEIEGRNT